MEQNKITFAEFNIGDKVVITIKGNQLELGTVAEFGYNCTDELIIGVRMVDLYNATTRGHIQWFHPGNKIMIVEKL
jgi:hypothetical protein